MTKVASDKKITVASVSDDLIGGLMVGAGGVTATVAAKVVNAKFSLHPLLVSLITIALGIGGRVGSAFVTNAKFKECLKDFSSGIIAAGSVDTVLKALDTFIPTWRTMLPDNVVASLPQALGSYQRQMSWNSPSNVVLNGPNSNILNGGEPVVDAPYEVVTSSILN